MPRDDNKNNDSRGRRDRPSGGKGRSGAKRGPDKKFGKREGGQDKGKADGERRPYAGKSDGAKSQGPRSYAKKPYAGTGKPYGDRDSRPPRRDGARATFPSCTSRGCGLSTARCALKKSLKKSLGVPSTSQIRAS